MQEPNKYAVFRTRCGYFGLLGTESSLRRTCLPLASRETVEAQLLKSLWPLNPKPSPAGHDRRTRQSPAPCPELDTHLLETLQEEIAAYFDGARAEVGRNTPITLDGLSPFTASVLAACREVRFGQTTTYSGLATKVGRPGGARAVGNALARNPLPLIIPCHRVVRSDGRIGGFSALGGTTVKKKMLDLEQGPSRA
jgi:methylated-DNA-[protein]-cysteine S-methyltransferase